MIRVQNIYYMLAYAFQTLNEQGYKSIATESFDNTAELLSAIICRGVSLQIKRGIGKDYVQCEEAISALRGKVNISESIKSQTATRKQLICMYDEFSENTYMNRIIKSTMLVLLKSDISKGRKKELRRVLAYLNNIDSVDLNSINWQLHYNRNNQTYRMLISICYFVAKGLIHTQTDGKTKVMDFLDEKRMHRLYEKFILEYYKKEHPELKASASRINWQLDTDADDMLPMMQTDIMLEHGDKTLIIDAKYYSRSMQVQFNKHTIHSGNLYQIFTYVKNKEIELSDVPHEVSGMILYARTDEDVYPENEYVMSGNKIGVRTLNLDSDFTEIRRQLDEIANSILAS